MVRLLREPFSPHAISCARPGITASVAAPAIWDWGFVLTLRTALGMDTPTLCGDTGGTAYSLVPHLAVRCCRTDCDFFHLGVPSHDGCCCRACRFSTGASLSHSVPSSTIHSALFLCARVQIANLLEARKRDCSLLRFFVNRVLHMSTEPACRTRMVCLVCAFAKVSPEADAASRACCACRGLAST